MSGLWARLRTFSVWQLILFVSLLALGFLITAQVRSETPRVQYTTQERQPLIAAVTDLQNAQDGLQTQILALRTQIQAAETSSEGSDQLVRQLNNQLLSNRIAAGLVALEGPGVALQLDDSVAPPAGSGAATDYLVSGEDVRAVVEQLWLAGAEAVSVNDERVVPSTAVIDIGGSILVNSAYLVGPYQVKAIGPADLYQNLAKAKGWVDFVQARATKFGIRISIASPPSLVIPAYAGSVSLRYARPVEATPAPSAGTSGPATSP